jgi:hypothetical protein
MVPTNGRCERARAILERLSKSIADLLRGELGASLGAAKGLYFGPDGCESTILFTCALINKQRI